MKTPKAILIHGLNNNMDALKELGNSLKDQFEIIYLTLPHHSNDRPATFVTNEAVDLFKRELLKYLDNSSVIISYSIGCCYLQYLFETRQLDFPLQKVIYLSPALRAKVKLSLLSFLPAYFPIPSLAPKEFRLRTYCYWGQYKTLAELTKRLELKVYPLIYADPQDEVIDLKGLSYISLKRDYLPYGKHHLTFHPKYYRGDEWKELIAEIKTRLRSEV